MMQTAQKSFDKILNRVIVTRGAVLKTHKGIPVMRLNNFVLSCLLCWLVLGVSPGALAQKDENAPAGSTEKELTIKEAAICEEIKEETTINCGVVFSRNLGKIYCFTLFDPVPEEMPILHKWFQRDRLMATIKLILKPPRWKTFSRMSIKGREQGPWRVEITDPKGHVLKILRFSVTD
jgi:hypothetical protein